MQIDQEQCEQVCRMATQASRKLAPFYVQGLDGNSHDREDYYSILCLRGVETHRKIDISRAKMKGKDRQLFVGKAIWNAAIMLVRARSAVGKRRVSVGDLDLFCHDRCCQDLDSRLEAKRCLEAILKSCSTHGLKMLRLLAEYDGNIERAYYEGKPAEFKSLSQFRYRVQQMRARWKTVISRK